MERGPEHASLDQYRAIVEQAPDAIVFADREGAVRVWNRRAEAVFGYSATEMLGNSLDAIIPERFRRAHWEGFRRAIDAGKSKYGDRALTTRSQTKSGGKLYVDLSFALVSGESGAVVGVLAVARDCTARHLKEKS